MIIPSSQNSIASSSSPDQNSLQFGGKPRVKAKKGKVSAAIPKTVDTASFKVQKKKKPKVTESRLWQKIDKYKSLEEGRAFVAPKHAVEYEAKLAQCVLDIEDDVRRFLPKGTREEKLGIIDNFWREVRANPWDVLKKAGHGSLDLKKFQRQTASFTYVSPSSSRASSPGPATSKKAETSHQESSLRSNRSSPAPTTVSQPPFPLQAQRLIKKMFL